MSAPHLKPPRVRVVDTQALEASAAALARGGDPDGAHARHVERVSFHLGPHRCALELLLVARAVTRLGEVVPLLEARQRIRGVAFIDNLPHVVVDLNDAAGAPARTAAQLKAAPALVVAQEGLKVAVAVDGPLDLVEGDLQLGAADAAQVGGVELIGRQGSGELVVAPAWFTRWLGELA